MEEMTKHTTAGLITFYSVSYPHWKPALGVPMGVDGAEKHYGTRFRNHLQSRDSPPRGTHAPPMFLRLVFNNLPPNQYCTAVHGFASSTHSQDRLFSVSSRFDPFRSVSFRWSVPICSGIFRFFSFCFDSIRFVSFRWPVPISSGKFRFFVSFRRVSFRFRRSVPICSGILVSFGCVPFSSLCYIRFTHSHTPRAAGW